MLQASAQLRGGHDNGETWTKQRTGQFQSKVRPTSSKNFLLGSWKKR